MPKTNSPDPNFGKCLQCAAVDRARYKVNPLLARSSFCTQCFQQYCFDPNNLTSSSALPNRKLNFVNPDPDGLSGTLGFLSRNKVPIILGFIGLFICITVSCVFLCVYSGESFDIWVDSDVVYLFFPVEYGENVGRVRLRTTRSCNSTTTTRHSPVTEGAVAARHHWHRTSI